MAISSSVLPASLAAASSAGMEPPAPMFSSVGLRALRGQRVGSVRLWALALATSALRY